MSEAVLNLDDFRKPNTEGGNVIVTFYFSAFQDESRKGHTHIFPVGAPDADFQSVIEKVRSEGGLFAPKPIDSKIWFFPWPPVAISIHVIDMETGKMKELT